MRQPGYAIDEAAAKVHLSVERLQDLLNSELVPHTHLDGGPARFKITELRKWIAENLLQVHGGIPLPRKLDILAPARDRAAVPVALRNIDQLQQIELVGPSGVYFLCQDTEVVYVGQASCIMGRVGFHVAENKKEFNAAFFIPVPLFELNDIEITFIKELNPKYNGGQNRPCYHRNRSPIGNETS